MEFKGTAWITSDTHYNHKNICRGVTEWTHSDQRVIENATRDFPNLDKMNYAICKGINDFVGPDDTLIHVGDWSFGGFDSIEEFRNRIMCKNIILILGNHDHHIKKDRDGIRRLFSEVHDIFELKFFKSTLMICHYPMLEWKDQNKGTFMLHGHCHMKGNDRFGIGRIMDIGIDGNPQFRPYKLTEVISQLENRVNKTHHPRQDFDNQK